MMDFIANTIQVHIAAIHPQSNQYVFLALLRSKDNPIYPLLWQALTGNVETGETAVEAVVRELNEETGLKLSKLWTIPYIAFFFDPYRDSVCASPVFGVLVEYSENIKISSEHESFEWLSLPDFIERMQLPSHKVGAQIFWDYILSCENKDTFEYKL